MRIALSSLTALLLAVSAISAHAAPNLGGLKLGDTEDALKQITLPLESKTDGAPGGPGATAYKYRTANGNELSITFKDGKAVWIENDWKDQPDDDESLIKGLVFDKFTVADIGALMGSTGYEHRAMKFHQMGDMLAAFNCYGLSDQPGTSIVFISSISIGVNREDIKKHYGQAPRLRSIVLAQDDYLDRLWGPEIDKDDAYHEVAWSAVDKQPSDAAVAALKHSVDLTMSAATTQEAGFSLTLPVGFHRQPIPGGGQESYMYMDTTEAHRLVGLTMRDIQSGMTTASSLDIVLGQFAATHQDFQHSDTKVQVVSGANFDCADWTGTKDAMSFGGRMCAAVTGGHQVIYFDLDIKHRYDDDAAIYQQVFGSLKLQ
jgi:hypothetical protein